MTVHVLVLISGIALGVVLSLLMGWLLIRLPAPKVKFGTHITKVNGSNGTPGKYRISFRNTGYRDLIDTEIVAELIIKGFEKDYLSHVSHLDLKINKTRMVSLNRKHRRAVFLDTSELPELLLPEYRDAGVDDLLRIPNASLRLVVAGYDRLGGMRKVFESKLYTVTDIRERGNGDK